MGSIVADESSVRVALRIRPQISRELIDGSKCCTTVAEGIPQVWIGSDHAYTYDYVFDTGSTQESVFDSVRGLVDGCLDGYNATILAYGQTGSGKTYTMGTGFDVETRNFSEISSTQGVIPRALHMIFDSIQRRRDLAQESGQPLPEFKVTAQFVELYNEEVFDLIEGSGKSTHKPPTNGGIQIREDAVGAIYLVGVGTKGVVTAEDALKCLYNGALSRTTASTNMNDESSRSHAIFTLHVKQQRIISGEDEMDTAGISDCETLSAKFHFVDLAGSERLKRTGAVGHRAKESISINSGLLSLGNVISALGDKSKKSSHVPYRDSKLTRLLQDSLGGNSRTMMIACVSPSERDFLETLNTLKYANRARNIKNKVTVNQDKNSNVISESKRTVHMLEEELAEYRQGKRLASGTHSDTHQLNILLQSENQALTSRVKSLQLTIDSLNAKNSQLLAEKATGTWILADNNANCDITLMVQKYIQEIEELGSKLYESEANCEQLIKEMEKERTFSLSPRKLSQVMIRDDDLEALIVVAKKEEAERLESRQRNQVDDDIMEDDEDDSDSSCTEDSLFD